MTTARMAEIGRFLFKYRKAGALFHAGADPFDEADSADDGQEAGSPERFVADLERLGPTFIKIGQSLSTRPDLVAPAYLEALERMQDDVAPLDAASMRHVIEEELGVRISKLFDTFDEEPIGSASLAQVHGATLRDGRRVAVKIQRPGVAASLGEDLDVLEKLTGAASVVSEVPGRYGFSEWIGEFRKTLADELDYRREGENLEAFSRHLEGYPDLEVPEPVWDYSTTRVLTMRRIDGVKVSKISELRRIDPYARLPELADQLVRAYLDQVFVHGVIHADPHPGNVLLTDADTLALLDLGMVLHLPPRLRAQLLKLLLAVMDGRGELVAELFEHVSTRLEGHARPEFVRECARLVVQYASTRHEGLNREGSLLLDIARIGAEHGFRAPAELPLLGKTLLNLDAVACALNPRQRTREVIRAHLKELLARTVRQSFSLQSLGGELLDVQELLHEAPRRATSILRTLAENRFRVHVAGLEESRLIESMQKIANRITTGVIAAGLILGAALMMRIPTEHRLLGYPALALVFFLIAFVLGIGLVVSMSLSDRKAKPREERDRL